MTAYSEEDDPVHSRIDVALWRRILAHARPYRPQLAGLAGTGMIVAACDVSLPRITGAIVDNAAASGGNRIWAYGLLYLFMAYLLSFMVRTFIRLAGVSATGVAYDLRRAAFAKLQELSFSFYDHRPVGWLMARLTSDCDKISSILPWALLDAVWGTLLLTGITSMMLLMNWKLALIVLFIVPPLSLATAVYQKKLIRTQRLARRTNSKMTAGFSEGIMGVRTSKAFVREDENLREFQVLTTEMRGYSIQNASYAAVYLPIVMTVGATGVGLAMWRGGLLTLRGALPLGNLIAFMQYAGLFHAPIQEMAERFTGLQSAQVSAERLQSLLDAPVEIQDGPGVLQESPPRGIAEVEFDHTSFSYAQGGPVLSDFNLRIRRGECIALVGETGGGKSTVAKLLCRFYEPTGGRILVDGVDYRLRGLHWLQSNLGIVLQAAHLFSGTIRENIRYGRLDTTDAEIELAAERVGADAFIRAFPEGYGTEVGEGGNRLSTGQKQLVALARALVAEPQIFVLDEATSSVDTETEKQIQAAIEVVLRGRISLVIAHRLSTVRAADRILVIDHGRIVEEGTHESLLRRQGVYARLHGRQFQEV
jgi:ATP-binding cassette, subfamily B, bacterial